MIYRIGGQKMIVLDYKDRRPLYERVMDRLQELMLKGVLPEEAQLPSVRSLATELAINPNTIQRAYGELERQGYIYSVKGKGSFVSDYGRIRQKQKAEWEKEFDEVIRRGFFLGAEKEEMAERICRIEQRMKAEGGEEND